MHDHPLFLQALSQLAGKLVTEYDVDSVIDELTAILVAILGIDGSGVALARDGALALSSAAPAGIADLEQVQMELQAGPCIDAFATGSVVAVADVVTRSDDWPVYCATAEQLGLRSVVGVPMRLAGTSVGALNLYSASFKEWSTEELAVSVVMADMATSYLINASKLKQQEQLTDQLQRALDSRAVIEQAKGVVAARHGVTVDKAFELIRAHARSHQVSIRAVADAIVNLGLTL